MQLYPTGAEESKYDIRTFEYSGTDKASEDTWEVGESLANTEYIEDQHKVGNCTAISLTMKARRHYGIDFSDDFQYLLQKKFIDKDWKEGSSALSACKVGKNYGFLPASEWTHTTIADRKLPYSKYIAKLRAIPDKEIERLLALSSEYKIEAYAKIANNIESLASAIAENGSVIARFVIGKEWWSKPIEPLRAPHSPISGHLVSITKRHGRSYRIANSWGTDWADGGTAYGFYDIYSPTEMWQIWFADVPNEIKKQQEKINTLQWQVLGLLQQLIELYQKRK